MDNQWERLESSLPKWRKRYGCIEAVITDVRRYGYGFLVWYGLGWHWLETESGSGTLESVQKQADRWVETQDWPATKENV